MWWKCKFYFLDFFLGESSADDSDELDDDEDEPDDDDEDDDEPDDDDDDELDESDDVERDEDDDAERDLDLRFLVPVSIELRLRVTTDATCFFSGDSSSDSDFVFFVLGSSGEILDFGFSLYTDLILEKWVFF